LKSLIGANLARTYTLLMLRNAIVAIFGLALFLFALMQTITLDHVYWWKATVLATEYAHYLAIIVLIWGYFLPRKIWSFLLQITLVTIFLIPAIAAEKIARQMQHKLSLKELFTGHTVHKNPPQTHVYKSAGQKDLRLDFYPSKNINSAWILIIHGGGWDSGDRTQLAEWNYYLSQQQQNGLAVFALDYSLAPLHHWPAARDDVADAIRFIRMKSNDFKINPDNYFLLGRSAGGQLAGAVAYGYKWLQLPKPRGVILFYTPTDLTFGYEVAEPHDLIESRSLISSFMGGDPIPNEKSYNEASPVMLVSPDSPPTLLLHGRRDNLSWYKHSERLARRLKAANIQHSYVELPWATHGFDHNPYGPGGQIARFAINDFVK
jgi:acetyl esterase/lipase